MPASQPTNDLPKSDIADVKQVPLPIMVWRSLFGGVLMGLANLVPGISGGTMLLVAGVYPAFIDSLAKLTRFKFDSRSLLVLGLVAGSAGIAVLLLAGTLKTLVIDSRWIMYSLFIGLTLGGIPIVWKLAQQKGPKLFIPAALSFAAMVALAIAQAQGVVGAGSSGFMMFLLAGLIGASAMILPGLSGGYLLLLMGQYVPILGAIHEFKDALSERDFAAAMSPALSTLLPVGIGVVVGIVLVGNLLKWLFANYQTATLGVLLGLLVGSTVGLFPFQQGRPPQLGDVIKAQVVTADNIETFDHDDWPVEYFTPSAKQAGGSIGLVLIGLAITLGVSKLGSDKPPKEQNE